MKFTDTTIDRRLKEIIAQKQDEKSLFYKDLCFSWKEVHQIGEKIAAQIIESGIQRKSRIGIWCQNSPLYICAFFGILKAGCTAVLINPAYTSYEMDQVLLYAQMEGIFCDEWCIKKLRHVKGMNLIGYIGMDMLSSYEIAEEPSEKIREQLFLIESQTDCHEYACMLCTSGTTGGAKGVELTHYQLLNVAQCAVAAMHWNDEDKVCVSLPLFHSFGLSTGLLAALFHKGCVCLNYCYKSEAVMECVEKFHCSVLNGVPTMFLSLLYNPERKNHDLSSLRSGIIAGSGVYEKDFLTIAREIPIPHLMQSYGQTEASPSITFSPWGDSLEKRAKSTGKAIFGVQIRITDLKTGEVLPSGEKGEVEIQGFNTMSGYFRQNAQTAKVLGKDGWMKTGDVGCLDEDGYLTICGRKKEMIIRGGENISPQEIEEVILSLEGVKQVKVFGIKAEVIQENIVACLVTDRIYSAEQIRNHVKKYLASYKVPKHIFFYSQFPEKTNGKIDVKRLKEIAKESISGALQV